MTLPDPRVRKLLATLNEWQAFRRDDIADTGEVASRIDALLGELGQLGATVQLRAGRYELVEPRPPRQEPR